VGKEERIGETPYSGEEKKYINKNERSSVVV
jgi:hypothetical protein